MPVIDFPDPLTSSVGDTFTESGKTWEYDGTAWNLVVGPLELATNSVTSGKIFNGSVLESKLANSAVSVHKIANGAVTSAKLATNSVGETQISNSSVTTAKLATESVTTEKLANASVTADKMAANAVVSSSIAANAVALGSQTTGNYVASLVAGTGVTLSNNSGEGATPTVAIGQAVGTTSEVTFSNLKTTSVIEPLSISATAATGTVAIDAANGTTYYTANATANWVVNLRWNSTTTLDSKLAVGEMTTASFMVRQGSTAYYPTSIQVNGTTTGVTTRWQGTTGAPTAGNANSTDMYTFTAVKTGAATFDVFAAQTRFA